MTKTLLAAISLAALALGSASASDVTVRIERDAFDTRAGTASVYKMLNRRARSACNDGTIAMRASRSARRACQTDILDQFVYGINAPELIAMHNDETQFASGR